MYICEKCGEISEELEEFPDHIDYGYGSPKTVYFYGCPVCGSCDVDEYLESEDEEYDIVRN